jgi:hypothetical protein
MHNNNNDDETVTTTTIKIILEYLNYQGHTFTECAPLGNPLQSCTHKMVRRCSGAQISQRAVRQREVVKFGEHSKKLGGAMPILTTQLHLSFI